MKDPKFLERMGFETPRGVQLHDMDDRLRNRLWDALTDYVEVLDAAKKHDPSGQKFERRLKSSLWVKFFGQTRDSLPYDGFFWQAVRHAYFQLPWNKVYEFFESIAGWSYAESTDVFFHDFLNVALKSENSGYRFDK